MVTQDVELFHATVRNNLTLYDPSIPDEAVLAAIGAVSMDEWLSRQPRGLDSVMNGAAGLSAGEAQLLSLARVFLRDPRLVILDEASSRLDPATERSMEKAVAALLEGRTAIIIAHRLETVQRADRIAILEQGRLVEEGRRADLAADPGSRFSRLLRTGVEEVLA
jgi:ATP-binding cassette subfamily B protein